MERSVFYFGHSVSSNNRFVDFFDSEIRVARLRIGDYSMTDFCIELSRAMTEASDFEYLATANRITRIVTLSSSQPFDILPETGDNQGMSALPLAGFALDGFGLSTYIAQNATGFEYLPQFPLQSFVDFDKISRPTQSMVNESANGAVEVVRFGATNFMECNVIYITEMEKSKGSPIENNPNGINEALFFLDYITQKKRIEFMKDRDNRASFTRCILESTSSSKDGTGFRLQELYARGLSHHFETAKLEFRKV